MQPILPPTPRIFTAEELETMLRAYAKAEGADIPRFERIILASHRAQAEEIERLTGIVNQYLELRPELEELTKQAKP